MSNNPMIIKKSISIKAKVKTVWNALTNPEITKQYMYGCAVISDWKLGSPIYWNGTTEDGQEITYVKGTIETIDSPNQVQFSMFDPNSGLADVPENYVSLSYNVVAQDDDTTLFSLEQGDYATVENSSKRYEESIQGWDFVLPVLKELTEKL